MRRAGQPQPTTPVKVLGDHATRIRRLEFRKQRSSGPRIVYGRIYDDGEVLDAGSGDWSCANPELVITIDPPFTERFAFVATPNDAGQGAEFPPDNVTPELMPVWAGALSLSGFVMAYQIDLGTVQLFSWDLDGNPDARFFGFDFHAVGV